MHDRRAKGEANSPRTNWSAKWVSKKRTVRLKTALKLPANGQPASSSSNASALKSPCGARAQKRGAGILVNIKNNSMKLTEILKYKATKGVQKPVKWEGPNPETYLESSFEKLPFEQAGQTIISKVTNEEKLELNTVL